MRSRRELLGALVGIATFVVGIVLLLIVFQMAYTLFTTPVESALGIDPKKPVELPETGKLAVALLVRVIMLLLMCFVASLIANRGIKLYAQRTVPEPKDPSGPKSEAPHANAEAV
ncbi:MAG: hypothetical protein JST40_13500 [Armatimonadetes bacterium]|nr:hypothetical protein [Armatimonadota bacterium]